MAHKDASVGSAQRTRRENVLHFLGLQNLRAGQARVTGPAGDYEREDHFTQTRAQKRGERNSQENSRKREESVDQNYIYNAVEPAAEIPCQGADNEPDDSRSSHYAYPEDHRNARAVNDTRKSVSAKLVGSHPMCEAGRLKTGWKILRRGAGRRDPRRSQCDDYEK